MNILFWTSGFWPRVGGIETQALRFIQQLQQRGHKCLVLAQRDHPLIKEEEHYQGIWVKRFNFEGVLNISKDSIIKNSISFKSTQEYLMRIIENFKVDILHFNIQSPAEILFFLFLKKIFQFPIVATLHSICLINNKPYSFMERAYAHMDYIGCVSQSVLEQVKMHLPSVFSKSQCIYNGLPFPELDPAPLPFNPPMILCLGRFTSEKGFDLAIKAFAHVREMFPNLHLILAGDGPEANVFKELAQTLNIASFVTFTGFIAQEDVPALLNQATLVLTPSHFESFGLVALEAAQMGRPVIATRVGGLPEVVVDQQTGILIPPNNIDALCEAIQLLLSHPEMAIAMGKAGRKRARECLSIDNVVDSYESLYLQAINNKQGNRYGISDC